MKKIIFILSAVLVGSVGLLTASKTTANDNGFIPLFNGKDLSGWTPAKENPDSFFVRDGELIAKGGRCHLFYTGDVNGGTFTNFELRLQVKTTPGSNSGVYFHTKYQDIGWPSQGYECQVNSSHKDPRKTGSLYGVVNILVLPSGKKEPQGEINLKRDKAPSRDGEWFDYDIKVVGKKITIKVNGETMVEYTEPEGGSGNSKFPGRKLGAGTFALQAHDPKSETHFRNIRVRVLD